MNRIRTLVDNAYSCDPRIKKFKEEEKAKKEAEKKAKAEAKRKEQEAKEKQRQAELEAARLAKEKEEVESQTTIYFCNYVVEYPHFKVRTQNPQRIKCFVPAGCYSQKTSDFKSRNCWEPKI